ncbi:MAG: sugar transferase [Oscillospiraceae bacterium]|nr:sugar transferase [Oscillospiraceae bacterium]
MTKKPSHRREEYKHLVSLAAALVLMGMLTLLFANTWYTHYAGDIVLPFYRRGNWVVIVLYTALLFLFFKVYGGLQVGYLRRTDVLFSQILAVFSSNILVYFQVSLIARNAVHPRPLLLMTLIELVVVVCWTLLAQRLYFALYPPRRLIIVYGSRAAAALVIKMSYRVDKYMICESISADEDYAQITDKLLQYDGVIIQDIPPRMRNDLLKFCFDHKMRAYIVPKVSDIILRGAQDIRLFDTPLLLCRNYGLTFEQRIIKRIFDIVFSLVMLVLCSPVMLVCAAAIKLCDGGPVLYRQERLTRGGKPFFCCKFRSMVPDAEKHGAQLAEEHDSRVTPVGRVLRRFRLDELPQLFNILKGDMSVVGPRPERPELAAKYEEEFPEFRFRLRVKAGLTGYAQVTGVYDTSPYDKLRMDLMYIERYSLFRDIEIILMTLKSGVFLPQKSNAELLSPEYAEETEKEDA